MIDWDDIFRIINNFYYTHTYAAIGIVIVLAIITFLKPGKMLKTAAFIAGIIAVVYIICLIGEALFSGYITKTHLLTSSPP